MHLETLILASSVLLKAVAANWITQQWEVIVVGAGPAGIIVATRMAEAGQNTLLLEAGGPSYGITGGDLDGRRPARTNLTRVDVPGLFKSIFDDENGLVCNLNSYGGCTVGGSSAINAGGHFEPPASDYDLYFPLGWKSKDMQNATRRLYARQPSTNLTSRNGIRYLQSGYTAARKWLVEGLGFEDIDINGKADKKTEVFGHPVFDYADGQRGGPTITYLPAALERSNLQLQTGVKVIRVERKGSQVTGVAALINGVMEFIPISPKGRVILSSGAFQSPSLLMFSGIGNPRVLSRLQLAGKLSPTLRSSQWIKLNAVGRGLFDNPHVTIALEGPDIEDYTYSYESPSPIDKVLYLQNRSGPYTFASVTTVFWDTLTRPDGSVAGLQGTIDSSGPPRQYLFSEDLTPKQYPMMGQKLINNAVGNRHTVGMNIHGTSGMKSTGNVVLGKDFSCGPDSNVYYSNPKDAEDIASFIHKIFRGLSSSGLTPVNIPQNATQPEIQTYITTPSYYTSGTSNQWSSSCRIGSCVDVNTTVVGMENLHVVDSAIIMPLSVPPQFGIMVAAERASDLILGMIEERK
ncbi:Cellobiose dehydrogenase [Lachnellula hyalina]|uniref:Cellobiose dehydrogenase n=1 Tax=Lachnellula hyalina TaxID=1316788 RepID=A0A8H8U0X1_9HELO|nr:Cellobiose dehydrogenase [Lachnellula hyalina]TVY27307.1 Cellobiose dehydrogenase [Lachnellula hyalina]